MIGAGLVARKARALGLNRKPWVKTSLAPGSPGGDRIPRSRRAAGRSRRARLQPRRLRLHHLHRQFRAAAAGDLEGDPRRRPGGHLGALGQPQLRGPDQPRRARQLPRLAAAGGGLRARRRHEHRPDHRAARPGHGRQGRLPQGHLADQQGDRRSGARDRHPRGVPAEIRRRLQGRREVAGGGDHRQPRPTTGRPPRPTSRTRPISRAWRPRPG